MQTLTATLPHGRRATRLTEQAYIHMLAVSPDAGGSWRAWSWHAGEARTAAARRRFWRLNPD